MDQEHLKHENDTLKAQLMTTSLINELTRVLHASNSPQQLMETLLLGIYEITGFERIIHFIIDKEHFRLLPVHSRGIPAETLSELTIPLGFEGGDITDAVFLNRHLLINGISPDTDPFSRLLESSSYLVMPLSGRVGNLFVPPENNDNNTAADSMISEDDRRRRLIATADFRIQGVLWLDSGPSGRAITSDDIGALSAILTQAGIIIENTRMFHALEDANRSMENANSRLKVVNHDLREAQAKINRDLEHARTIQRGLLPESLPSRNELSIGALYVPADAVGGDYYDVFEIEPDVYAVIVADVSGHGVSSALIMSMVKVLLKIHAKTAGGPQKTLEAVNAIFQNEIKSTNFVTVFYGILDIARHNFTWTSAGHCPTIFIDKEKEHCDIIKADGLFLGIFPDMMLEQGSLDYKPGTQRIVLYTDGLTEARNPDTQQMFELDRLVAAAMETLPLSPEMALSRIVEIQKDFVDSNEPAEDDITLLVIDF